MSETIRQLNEERLKRWGRLMRLGMMNAYGLDAEQRLKQDAAYKLANDAWAKAELAYQNAIRNLTPQELANIAGEQTK